MKKKTIWIIGIFLLVGLIGGVYYFGFVEQSIFSEVVPSSSSGFGGGGG